MVALIYNPSTQEAVTKLPKVWGKVFQASPGYSVRPCLRKQETNKQYLTLTFKALSSFMQVPFFIKLFMIYFLFTGLETWNNIMQFCFRWEK